MVTASELNNILALVISKAEDLRREGVLSIKVEGLELALTPFSSNLPDKFAEEATTVSDEPLPFKERLKIRSSQNA